MPFLSLLRPIILYLIPSISTTSAASSTLVTSTPSGGVKVKPLLATISLPISSTFPNSTIWLLVSKTRVFSFWSSILIIPSWPSLYAFSPILSLNVPSSSILSMSWARFSISSSDISISFSLSWVCSSLSLIDSGAIFPGVAVPSVSPVPTVGLVSGCFDRGISSVLDSWMAFVIVCICSSIFCAFLFPSGVLLATNVSYSKFKSISWFICSAVMFSFWAAVNPSLTLFSIKALSITTLTSLSSVVSFFIVMSMPNKSCLGPLIASITSFRVTFSPSIV